MDDEWEPLMVRVRADAGAFRRDVAEMRASLEGPLEAGAERAGRAVEGALSRAVRTGKLGFDDLKRAALSVLAEIAGAAVRQGLGGGAGGILGGLLGGAGRGDPLSAGLVGPLSAGLGALIGGLPGRATGGPVGPGRAYLVGERGPELFVPTASGRVEAGASRGGGAREVRVAITVQAPAGMGGPEALARSGRQVARAVRAALREE
ncbi:MAG TPA: tail tape measure protein [Sphingomonas sp.]